MDKELIFERHKEQKWGELPYRVHLENVALVASRIDPAPRIKKIAYAHDILEDTDTLPEELDDEIRASVILISRNYSQGEMNYHEYILWLARSNDNNAKKVKLADALVNYSLSKHNNNPLMKRYEKSIPVLWWGVFNKEIDWNQANSYISGVRLEL